MKPHRLSRPLTLLIAASLLSGGAALAETPDLKKAEEILKKADDNALPYADAEMLVDMVIQRPGDEEERITFRSWEKGDQRLLKFLEPGDVKGLGVLVENLDVVYVYVPAFKKVRRVASHARTQSFQGSDYSLEDMATARLANSYDVKKISDGGESWVLELHPKKGKDVGYPRIDASIDKKENRIVALDFFDGEGTKLKSEKRSDFKALKGHPEMSHICHSLQMVDHRRGSKTRLELKEVNANVGIKDKKFNRRSLVRAH